MQKVRQSIIRWIAQVADSTKRAKPQRAVREIRTLDPSELQSVKGGDGSSTTSPTKTW